jgi:hypothetical protein
VTTKTIAVSCSKCGLLFAEGDYAWASDWRVLSGNPAEWRMETRYLCDTCHEGGK